jgi:hypothetical protein
VTRAIRISLESATNQKQRRLLAMVREYRSALNFYSRLIFSQKGELHPDTWKKLTAGSLTSRQRVSACRVAWQQVNAAADIKSD